MDLTPPRQRILAAAVTVLLVIVGFFVIKSRHSDSQATPVQSQSPPPSVSASTTSPAASSVPPTAAIYKWLPFTPADLTKAVNIVTAFSEAYQTWSYSESESVYGAALKRLVTPDELILLEGYQYGTTANKQMTAHKEASTGSGAIGAITSWASHPKRKITFSVTMNSTVTSTSPPQSRTGNYAVTVESTAAGWGVDDIELLG